MPISSDKDEIVDPELAIALLHVHKTNAEEARNQLYELASSSRTAAFTYCEGALSKYDNRIKALFDSCKQGVSSGQLPSGLSAASLASLESESAKVTAILDTVRLSARTVKSPLSAKSQPTT